MISQHFIDPSAIGWLKISPDLQYVAIGGPGAPFRLYRDNGNLLLRATLPFELEANAVAFRVVAGVCTGLALLTYDFDPKIVVVDLKELSTMPTAQVAGASAMAFSADGTKLLVGIDNGLVLEYSQDDQGRFNLGDGSGYSYCHQLPSESRVTKVVAADGDGVIVAYNDDSQLFYITPAETFELLGIDQTPSGFRIVKHHSSLPLLAAIKHDGSLVIRDMENGMLCELSLVDPSKNVVSLSFAPNGDVFVATKSEVVQISLFVSVDEQTGETQIQPQTAEIYSSNKDICAAEVSELPELDQRLTVLYH